MLPSRGVFSWEKWASEARFACFPSARGWFKGVNLAPKEKVLAEPGNEMQFPRFHRGCKVFSSVARLYCFKLAFPDGEGVRPNY